VRGGRVCVSDTVEGTVQCWVASVQGSESSGVIFLAHGDIFGLHVREASILFHLIPSHLILSHPIPLHFVSHPNSSHPIDLFTSHLIPSHLISLCSVSSHRRGLYCPPLSHNADTTSHPKYCIQILHGITYCLDDTVTNPKYLTVDVVYQPHQHTN
jgi:hypothetical protein